MHVLPRRAEWAVRANDVFAVSLCSAGHAGWRERLTVWGMALVANGIGRTRSGLLLATRKRIRLPEHVPFAAKRTDDHGIAQRLSDLPRSDGQTATRY